MISRTAAFFLCLGLAACSKPVPPPTPVAASPTREQAVPPQVQPVASEAPAEVTAPNFTELSRTAKWDTFTVARADFNSDDLPDEASIGYFDGGLLLAIDTSRPDGTKERTLIPFGIGHSQDSICTAPATLRVEVAFCSVEGEDLPGCRAEKKPSGLELGDRDGDCDPIHLYWNHQQDRMNWWRH